MIIEYLICHKLREFARIITTHLVQIRVIRGKKGLTLFFLTF